MNILIENLPEAVEVDEKVYKINTDFRNCLRIILAYEDNELSDREKVFVMLRNLYGEKIPQNLKEAVRMAVKFLNCGEERDEENAGDSGYRLYSFSQDAKYIYSAIKQSHGVDLETVHGLHWWKFCYMFLDLKEDCFFNRMVSLRQKYFEGKLTKEERGVYAKLRNILEIEQTFTAEEKAAEERFMKLLKGGETLGGGL